MRHNRPNHWMEHCHSMHAPGVPSKAWPHHTSMVRLSFLPLIALLERSKYQEPEQGVQLLISLAVNFLSDCVSTGNMPHVANHSFHTWMGLRMNLSHTIFRHKKNSMTQSPCKNRQLHTPSFPVHSHSHPCHTHPRGG